MGPEREFIVKAGKVGIVGITDVGVTNDGTGTKDGLVINKKEMQLFAIRGTNEQLAAVIPLEANANFWKKIGLKVSNQIQWQN